MSKEKRKEKNQVKVKNSPTEAGREPDTFGATETQPTNLPYHITNSPEQDKEKVSPPTRLRHPRVTIDNQLDRAKVVVVVTAAVYRTAGVHLFRARDQGWWSSAGRNLPSLVDSVRWQQSAQDEFFPWGLVWCITYVLACSTVRAQTICVCLGGLFLFFSLFLHLQAAW